jgi:NAD(P) transhydrogenase subunit beta
MSHMIEIAYLLASVAFIMGLKFMGSAKTARKGMFLAELGMLLAIAGTLVHHEIVSYEWIAVGLALGTVIGIPLGLWVPMTAMPERIALSHAFGALAAALVGVSEYYRHVTGDGHIDTVTMIAIGAEVMLGSLTFTGSLVASAKLHDTIKGNWVYKGVNYINMTLLAGIVGIVIYLIFSPSAMGLFFVMMALAMAFGVMLVMPIGAADMPVVISILNSYAGLAASATGFVISNKVLIIAGALDGASGIILSLIMYKAMNRSAANVFFGGFGTQPEAASAPAPAPAHAQAVKAEAKESGPVVKKLVPEEAAMMFKDARRVIVVPGYGMAAAQAQHVVGEFASLLKEKNVSIKYAIHPVAGRMPGHMNVLLAEAGIPYTDLIEMEDINHEFPETDIAIVIGANDTTNPAARYDTKSPIYGMPILDVDKAKSIIVCKRSMKPGFAGIDNELYLHKNTKMLFGDAKDSIGRVVSALKDPNLKSIPAPAQEEEAQPGQPSVRKVSPEQAADMFRNSKKVIVVPGYGMAAAQAQHAVGEFAQLLKEKNVDIKYAIHPVAGRMPGHMNVLLAEAGIPYTDLLEMDEINHEFEETDIAIVIGANDTTNPAARYDKKSPIYGMPILNVDKAKNIIVCKRSMKPGFAGIDNELYLHKNTRMLFGDAKDSISKVVQGLK